jgi:hypothetical protein
MTKEEMLRKRYVGKKVMFLGNISRIVIGFNIYNSLYSTNLIRFKMTYHIYADKCDMTIVQLKEEMKYFNLKYDGWSV